MLPRCVKGMTYFNNGNQTTSHQLPKTEWLNSVSFYHIQYQKNLPSYGNYFQNNRGYFGVDIFSKL